MDYGKAAKEVCDHIGGRENIISAAHCATRLRLVIADNKKCSKEALENIDGVKGVFEAAGQLQIIFGTGTVNKVYDEFVKLTGISEASKDEVKQAAAKKQNPFKRAIKTLGDIFVPIIPAIVASGLLMGLRNLYDHPSVQQRGFRIPAHSDRHQCRPDFWRQPFPGRRHRYDYDPYGSFECLERSRHGSR